MILKFIEEGHQYISDEPIDWISVTTIIDYFKEKFDVELQAERCSKNKNSKWYGYTKEQIKQFWKEKKEYKNSIGTAYHKKREAELLEFKTLNVRGQDVPIIPPKIIDNIKYAPVQVLEPGVYPEHFIYLQSAGITGQADRVEVADSFVDIYDYKTNDEITMNGYRDRLGNVKKLKFPLSHLEDCKFNLMALQLSFYMYIILKHNPNYRAGNLVIQHIKFEEEGRDKFDNIIYKLDSNEEPIVKDVEIIKLPYLYKEIHNLLLYIKDNREKIKNHKYDKVV